MTAQELSPTVGEATAQQLAENRRAPLWRRPFTWLIVLVGLAFALLPTWGDNVQLRESLSLAAVYITLASSLNIMLGYSGYVNFGNIVFFGLGGYICVYLVSEWLWPLAAAALVAGVAVSLLALIFGLGILRLRGAFFALATIGVNEAVKAFVSNFEPWGGATGIYLSLDVYQPLGGPVWRHCIAYRWRARGRGLRPSPATVSPARTRSCNLSRA
jgi:branched-chain amino acid transport system permease protein